MSGRPFLVGTAAVGLAAAGCTGINNQSALDPAGVQAGRIHGLWDLFLAVCVIVYVLVMAFVIWAVARRRGGSDRPVTAPPANQDLRTGVIVGGCVVLTVVVLFGLLIADFLTGRGIDSLAADADPLVVKVTGHQWWWEVEYQDPVPSHVVTTANEIHIPVGRTVRVELSSSDVIHSFWVPNLHGKTDMIPGRPTRTFLRADREGLYWGQCAEFCGHQHANMRLQVVARPEAEFQAWLAAQRRPAPEPTAESQKRGQQVFLTRSCVLCHTVAGTTAQSRVGPPLTHVAGRARIAAGTLPNTRGHLGGWVSDPQSVKPGVRMPPNPLAPDELRALLDYLETLK